MKKNLSVFAFALLFMCAFSWKVYSVRADEDLIIGDDGNITLVIDMNGVLGVATSVKQEEKPAPVQKAEHTAPPSNPQPAAKTEPLVQAHTESTVHIDPPANGEKKIQVIITTTRPQNATTQPSTIGTKTNVSQQPTSGSVAQQPIKSITKTVDQVVAQGANGQPVLRIKSEKANQLTVEQGTTHVTTALPLQIDTLTNSLSVTPRVSSALPVLVLPSEAMQGIIDKGLLNANSANQAKINLTKDTNGINYTVSSQKQGKLFGIFPVQSPVQVKLSAQNGKVVQASQSVLFSIFGTFIR